MGDKGTEAGTNEEQGSTRGAKSSESVRGSVHVHMDVSREGKKDAECKGNFRHYATGK